MSETSASVKIGPLQYYVKVASINDPQGFDMEKWGDVRHNHALIRIREASHPQLALITLVHECIHCINFMLSAGINEEYVEILAPALVMFLEDNGVDLNPLRDIVWEAQHGDRT